MTSAILVHYLPIELIICLIYFGERKPQVTYEMENSAVLKSEGIRLQIKQKLTTVLVPQLYIYSTFDLLLITYSQVLYKNVSTVLSHLSL